MLKLLEEKEFLNKVRFEIKPKFCIPLFLLKRNSFQVRFLTPGCSYVSIFVIADVGS